MLKHFCAAVTNFTVVSVLPAQLNSAISGTSNNTNGVSTLDTGLADPDMEALRLKLNEMILNGRR